MPRVPTYEPTQRLGGIPQPRVAVDVPRMPDASAAPAITQEAGRAVADFAKFYETQKRQADELKVLELDNRTSEFTTRFLYEPKSGALTRKGKNALSLPDEWEKAWQAETDEIDKEISNDEQRFAWEKIKQSRRQDVERQLLRHVSVQGREYDDQVTQSFIANERNAAASNPYDDERIQRSIGLQRDQLLKYADRNGEPPEWVQEKLLDATSKTHQSVMARLLMQPGSEMKAKDYFSKLQVGVDITPEDAKGMERMVNEGALRFESMRLADEIFQKTGGQRGAALKEFQAIGTPELRKETEQRFEHMLQQRKLADKERREDLYLKANSIVDNYLRNGQTVDPRTVIPVAMWTSLEPNDQQALLRKSQDLVTNKEKYVEFLGLSRGQLASMSAREFDVNYRSHFSNEDQRWADNQYKAAQNMDERSQLQTPFSEYKDLLDETLRLRDIVDPSNPRKKDSDAQLYFGLAREVRKQVEDFETMELGGKRRATRQEIQKVIDENVIRASKKVKIQGSGLLYNSSKPIAVITDEDRNRTYVPISQIPAESRASLERRMQEAGKKVTEDKLQRAYAATLAKDKARLQAIIAE